MRENARGQRVTRSVFSLPSEHKLSPSASSLPLRRALPAPERAFRSSLVGVCSPRFSVALVRWFSQLSDASILSWWWLFGLKLSTDLLSSKGCGFDETIRRVWASYGGLSLRFGKLVVHRQIPPDLLFAGLWWLWHLGRGFRLAFLLGLTSILFSSFRLQWVRSMTRRRKWRQISVANSRWWVWELQPLRRLSSSPGSLEDGDLA